jgi:hypothetical protein
MTFKRVFLSTAALAIVAGCSAAPSEDATASGADLIRLPPFQVCVPNTPTPQWWDYSIDTAPGSAWFDLSLYEAGITPWVDAVGIAWHPFVALSPEEQVTDIVWVAAPNTDYFACVNMTCDIHPSSGIDGRPPVQDPGGGTRLRPNCGNGTCPEIVTAAPSVCVTSSFISAANPAPFSGESVMCSNTAACIPRIGVYTPVGGGGGIHIAHPM